ncbi:hypothetical protein COCON_G00181030 [Conger conger]|uniref:Uncharacterized protein n=1 Tax=Conger conger TaxID=82655 RepID=A0A9Q1HTA8_CONCO|nr:hypothetical protein COCON_G00181030 [Conger conger]
MNNQCLVTQAFSGLIGLQFPWTLVDWCRGLDEQPSTGAFAWGRPEVGQEKACCSWRPEWTAFGLQRGVDSPRVWCSDCGTEAMIRVQLLFLVALAGHLHPISHARTLVGVGQITAEAENVEPPVVPDVPDTVKEGAAAAPTQDQVPPADPAAPEIEPVPEEVPAAPEEEPGETITVLPIEEAAKEEEAAPVPPEEEEALPVVPEEEPSTEEAPTAPEEELVSAAPEEQPVPEEVPSALPTEAPVPPTEDQTEAYAAPPDTSVLPPEAKTEAPPPKVIPICVPAAEPDSSTNSPDEVGATVILLEEKPAGVSRGLVLGAVFGLLVSLIAVGSAGKVVSRKVGRYTP